MAAGHGRVRSVVVVGNGDDQSAPSWLGEVVAQGIEAIVVFDADLRLVYANRDADRLLRYEVGTLVGLDVLSLVHPDDLKRAGANIVGVSLGAKPDAGLIRILCGDAMWRDFEVRPRQVDLPGPPSGPGPLTAVSLRDNTQEDSHWTFLAQLASGADFDEAVAAFAGGLSSLVDGPMAVTYEADGGRRTTGRLPGSLAWPDRFVDGSPWAQAVASGAPVIALAE